MPRTRSPLPRRRALLLALATACAPRLLPAAPPPRPRVEVWKSASCGCCHLWIEHLQANGFEVLAHDVPGPADVREQLGMPSRYGSCHTARVSAPGAPGSYLLEGHVPAREIYRLLKDKPAALGLAVPGMPLGSPGMEQGPRRDPYDVLLVTKDGRASVYQSYR